jgi:hypothetical protein
VRKLLVLIPLLVLTAGSAARADDWRLLLDLRGLWKFEIGDDQRRAAPEYDDRMWETIRTPSAWEDQGFPGYDGYAWYRKHFRAGNDWKGKALAIHLGTIDDVDQVYCNGNLVGSTGSFPPAYRTAYSAERSYQLPFEYLRPDGDNVIAVRVYDAELSGGITSGRIGIYEGRDLLLPDLPVVKGWRFRTGDSLQWSAENYNDSRWRPIVVPSSWEGQGYEGYDGFAWYRVRFTVPADLANQKTILLLGRIDDYDVSYLNGKEIGHIGAMENRLHEIPGSNAYQQLRAYYIPPGLLHAGSDNVIAVRVYDGFQDGGICSGPVGIITRDHYLRWKDAQARPKGWFDWLFR